MTNIDSHLSLLIELILVYWPFAAAVVFGLVLPTIAVGLSGVIATYPDHLKLTAIFAFIVIGSTLAIAFSGRTIVSEADLATHPRLSAVMIEHGNYWFSRVAHFLLLSVSIAELFLWVTQKRHIGRSQFILWSAAMIYYTFSVLVSGILGHFGEFNINLVYAPIVFTAVVLLAPSDYQKTLRSLRWIVLFPLLGSLIAMWVAPRLVLETGYNGLIPGFNIRLAGLTEHANSLGIIAVIGLFLELSKYVCDRPNVFFLLVSGANLVLAQSKTSWVIAIVGFIIFGIAAVRKRRLQEQRRDFDLMVLCGAFFLATVIFLIVLFKFDSMQAFLVTDRTGLVSFTGRTRIWDVTLNEFLNNPISGYGPSIWDLSYRFQHEMMHVGQAHNQYVQTLGQAGILGISGLTFYIYLLVLRGYQGWSETYGFSFFIVTVLLIRGFSESPMRMIGIMDFDSFTHLFAFATVAALILQNKTETANIKVRTLR